MFRHIIYDLLLPLLSLEAHTQISFRPTALSLVDIAIVIILWVLRSAFQTITQLLGLRSINADTDGSLKAPNLTLSMPLQLSKSHVDRYCKAIDSGSPHDVEMNNSQLLLFLSSISEPAMLLLLAKRGCPIRPLGSVNVRNRFELLRTDGKPAPLLQADNAVITASLHSLPRTVKRGLEYDVETTLTLPDPQTGEHIPVFRQVFTLLQFMKVKQVAKRAGELKMVEHSSYAKMPVKLTFEEPSNWAAISKDYNPIHIFALAARGYGFPGKIAHGNHVLAKSLHTLGSKSRDSAKVLLKMNTPIWMEVKFTRPMTVPADLELRVLQSTEEESVARFEVSQRDKVCIEGTLGVLEA